MVNQASLYNLFLKENVLEEANQIFFQISNVFSDLGLDFNSFEVFDLKSIPIKNLETIEDLDIFLKKLSDIHLRIESSSEFLKLKTLIEQSRKIQKEYQDMKILLQRDSRKLFSKIHNEISKKSVNLIYSLDPKTKNKHKENLENYFSFSDFQPLIEESLNENNSYNQIYSLTDSSNLEKLFLKIKNKVISKKIDINEIVENYGKEIQIDQLKEKDIVAYEFLRGRALSKVAMDKFEIEVSSHKSYEQRIVRPSDPLSRLLKLNDSEIAIFAISVDPIKNFGLKTGSKMESSLLPFLVFEIENDQKQMKVIQKINIHIEDDLVVDIITPVYISYIKAKLIKSQQNQSIKIV